VRLPALFILAALFAFPAFAQQSKGITACSIESVNQTDGITVITVASECRDITVSSTGQTGGITAGYVGSVTQSSTPKVESISLCRTGAVMDIAISGKVLNVKGGRLCLPRERPSVILDAETYAIIGGTNTGVVNMSIKEN